MTAGTAGARDLERRRAIVTAGARRLRWRRDREERGAAHIDMAGRTRERGAAAIGLMFVVLEARAHGPRRGEPLRVATIREPELVTPGALRERGLGVLRAE